MSLPRGCGGGGKDRQANVGGYHSGVVTIFLSGGSSGRGPETFRRAAFEFGRGVARRGWILRTGAGGGRSIMGAAADGALSEGGRVEGVILEKFWRVRHRRLHALRVCRTFAGRKAGLLRGAEAAVFFPGGCGTLDELGDAIALRQNGFTEIPILLVNLGGFFDPLLEWFRRAGRDGFLYGDPAFETVRDAAGALRRLDRLGLQKRKERERKRERRRRWTTSSSGSSARSSRWR